MRYILRETIAHSRDYYVYSARLICHKLKNAKVFETIAEADNFKQDKHWAASYVTVSITETELFKAKLSDS